MNLDAILKKKRKALKKSGDNFISRPGKLNKPAKAAVYIGLALFGAVCVLPFMLSVIISFTPQRVISLNGYSFFPKGFTLEAYRTIFVIHPQLIGTGYLISFSITAIGTAISVLVCLLTSFALAQQRFTERRIVGFLIFFNMLFSGGLIPTYIFLTQFLSLGNTIWVLILPLVGAPMNIFLLRMYIQGLPSELYESAKLDGANEYIILFRIVAPLVVPGIATIALFTVLMYWNNTAIAKLYISDQRLYPLQLTLFYYTDLIRVSLSDPQYAGIIDRSTVPTSGMLFAMSVIATGPMLAVFLFFQKYFVSGLTAGAVKE